MAYEDATLGVRARDVRRSFGEVEALRGVDLTAPYGEVTALVGPNGSGKTTLFLILATLLVPDGGQVTVAGHDLAADPEAIRPRIGWMPDSFGMYDQLTVQEYLTFFARSYRLPQPSIRDRIAALLQRVQLDGYEAQPVRVLSRGQKQRLGIARTLVHEPAVLLLDEPASGLDPRARIELRDLLRRLADEGIAVIVSSHILAELEEIADSVVIVDQGATAGTHYLEAGLNGGHQRQPWRLRALDGQALLDALDSNGVGHGPLSPNGIDIQPHSEPEIAELLAALVSAGVRVVGCTQTVSDVEAAYLELTQESQ